MVCLDTSFLIDVILGKPIIEKFGDILDAEEQVTVASPSVMELIKGIYLKKNLKYSSEDERKRIDNVLSSLFILDLDKESAYLAGKVEADLLNKEDQIGIIDIMIGAIAKHNDETLITRNKKHFEKIKGLEIESY